MVRCLEKHDLHLKNRGNAPQFTCCRFHVVAKWLQNIWMNCVSVMYLQLDKLPDCFYVSCSWVGGNFALRALTRDICHGYKRSLAVSEGSARDNQFEVISRMYCSHRCVLLASQSGLWLCGTDSHCWKWSGPVCIYFHPLSLIVFVLPCPQICFSTFTLDLYAQCVFIV